jgi:hypothetical protein
LGDLHQFVFFRSGDASLLLSYDCVPAHIRPHFQEKIMQVQRKETEAAMQADADLARNIIMDSMLAGPFFGGAGAVLNISSSSSSSTQQQQQPLLLDGGGRGRRAGGRGYSFHIVERLPPAAAASSSPPSSSSGRTLAMNNMTTPATAATSRSITTLLPVHLVVYLYDNSSPSPVDADERHRHISTLEFPMLRIDDTTHAMRERQVLTILPKIIAVLT